MPLVNLKSGSLLYAIQKQKPSLNIKAGVFYNGIEGYSIKIEEKSDDGNLLITGHDNGEAVVWNILIEKEISKFYIGNENPIIDSKIYGNKAIISDGIKISVFDLIDSKPISTSLVRTEEKGSPSIKLSNDGEFAVVDKLYLWDIKKNKKKFDLGK